MGGRLTVEYRLKMKRRRSMASEAEGPLEMTLEAFISKLDVDDSLFDRETFLTELGKSASREELTDFVEQLKRSCSTLKTERISFINDKYPEVIDAIQTLTQVQERFQRTREDLTRIEERIDEISGDFENVKSPNL